MRDRSMALVIRDGRILVEKVYYYGRYFYTIPGGGIEPGETPPEAAIRELKEECGLGGEIIRQLATIYREGGEKEHVFLVKVSDEQEAIVGYDPEEPADAQAIKDVCWRRLDEIPERDRAFLWSYGLLGAEEFFREVVRWGDALSYPTAPAADETEIFPRRGKK